MNTYIVGQVIFFRIRLTDPSTGDPNDPATQQPVDDPTIAAVIYKPDKSLLVPAPGLTRESVGTYSGTFQPDVDGPWQIVSNSTGAATGRGRDRVYVEPVP